MFFRSFTTLAIVTLLAVPSAQAAIWVGGTSGNWSDAGNWDVAPVNGASLTFSGTGNQTNVNDAGITSIGTLTLSNGGWNIDLGGSQVAINAITSTDSSDLTGNLSMNNSASHTVTLNGTSSSLTLNGTLALIRANNTTTLNVIGPGNTLLLGGLNLGIASSGRTVNNSADVTVIGAVTEGRTSYFRKSGTGTLTLNGLNTYTGQTEINAGTFKLGIGGNINNSTNITLAAGASFDVSAQSAYILSTNLTAGGTATVATIKGASAGTVSLGGHDITLTWGGASSGEDSTHPPLTVTDAELVLNNDPMIVNVPGTALGEGVYTLISAPGGISGNLNSTPVYSGNGQDPGLPGSVKSDVSISGTSVILTIAVPPSGTVVIIR